MARKIVITSGKGGVGKTTVCANLGYKLALLGNRVVLVDVDIGLNNLDVVTGVENKIVFDIVDVIQNKCRANQALLQDINQPNLYIMPSAHSYNKVCVTAENIKKVIQTLDTFFDFVLIDCPAGIDEPFYRAIVGADEALVVVTPHISSLRDADKVIVILNSFGITNINIIVNRVRGDLVLSSEMMDVKSIEELLKTNLIGVVPEDDTICKNYSIVGTQFNGNSDNAFLYLAQNISLGTRKIFDCTKAYRGFWGYLKRTIKRRV